MNSHVSCQWPHMRYSILHGPFRDRDSSCPSVWLYNTIASYVDSSVACALITTFPGMSSILIQDFLYEALLIFTVSQIFCFVCILETVVLTCCHCWWTWIKARELLRVGKGTDTKILPVIIMCQFWHHFLIALASEQQKKSLRSCRVALDSFSWCTFWTAVCTSLML